MEHDRPQDGPPPAEVAGYAYLPPDSPAYWQSGTCWRLLSSAEQTARSCTFDELCPPGLVAPPHVHDAEEEAFFVLEGNLVFTLEDGWRHGAAGDRRAAIAHAVGHQLAGRQERHIHVDTGLAKNPGHEGAGYPRLVRTTGMLA